MANTQYHNYGQYGNIGYQSEGSEKTQHVSVQRQQTNENRVLQFMLYSVNKCHIHESSIHMYTGVL